MSDSTDNRWHRGTPEGEGLFWVCARQPKGWTWEGESAPKNIPFIISIEGESPKRISSQIGTEQDDYEALKESDSKSWYSVWNRFLFWKRIDMPEPPETIPEDYEP